MGRATDYSNCYIYHIVDSDKVVHYVGSTSNFNSRKSKHKYSCNTENRVGYDYDIYKYIRDNGGWNTFDMIPIRKIENVSNKTEVRIAEQAEINKFSTLKNKYGSYLSPEQHIANGLEATRIWRKKNPEKLSESNRKACIKYVQNNPEKVLEIRRKWRQENPEKVLEYHRKYRLRQKELKAQDQ